MGRIFLSAGHGGIENGKLDPGTVRDGTTEAREMMVLRDAILAETRSRNFEVLPVPDDLDITRTIRWINDRQRFGDIAIELHSDAFPSPLFQKTAAFFIGNNSDRKRHADLVLLAITRRVPQLSMGSAIPDTSSGLGSIRFCRETVPPSLYLHLAFFTNPSDRALLQTRRPDIAAGITDGLIAWSRALNGEPNPEPPPPTTYPSININLNGRLYGEQGILVNGNAYIPIDLADRLGLQLNNAPNVKRVSYGNVVYIRAVDLREFDISVSWDDPSRTVSVRSILQICRQLHEITGKGYTSEVQMLMFLKTNYEPGISQFPDLARLYRDEASQEGINHDIAFAQMCVETNFLRFGGAIQPSQNNFGGLGSAGGNATAATFPSARIGIRAHVQHLKAYANTEPLREAIVDPRFDLVTRGIAPYVELLTGRWSSDPNYGDRIMSLMRQLYESAGLL
jgi:Mannosyl-glycoprotein endo-beta-N-acetylglucosaminidase/N-acetylmuramoyl-L-alanine amidase